MPGDDWFPVRFGSSTSGSWVDDEDVTAGRRRRVHLPPSVPTVASQRTAAGLTWKGYMQDLGNDPAREAAMCAHPALNTQDQTQSAVAGDGYVTRHNPFVYFHAII